MRIAISLACFLAGLSATAQTPPPGSIVIRPKGSVETPAPTISASKPILQTDPDRPGYYVIRPSGRIPSTAGSTMLPAPREGVPHLEIIRPKSVESVPVANLPKPTTPPVWPAGSSPCDWVDACRRRCRRPSSLVDSAKESGVPPDQRFSPGERWRWRFTGGVAAHRVASRNNRADAEPG